MSKIDETNLFLNANAYFQKKPIKKQEKSDVIKSKKTLFDNLLSTEESQQLTENESYDNNREIETQLKEIGIIGEKIKKNRNLTDLDQYKKKIKAFISLIINKSESIDTKFVWNKTRKEKIAKVHLKVIDKELKELTNIFFSEQRSVLKIASQIDKIEGILIDLSS